MRAAELREKTNEELLQQYAELKQELFNLRIQRETKQLANPKRMSAVRKDIARILTILRERGLKI
ncbi:50S ribosomal protein L29 [bacterium]|nr:50S ribosomal protein L29 [bacterium]